MVLNLIFLGPPGAGKGTVAQAVMDKYKLVQVSTGDLLRAEIASGSELGKKLAEVMNAGQLVSDDLVSEMLLKDLTKKASNPDFNGVIFDGFPRTQSQASMLENILLGINQKLNAVIYIESSKESVVKRLSSRWTCEKCKKVYNTVSLPPKSEGICDDDGGNLIQRDDDKPETISKRYDTFIEKTSPLIDYYKSKGILYKYDGNVPPVDSIKAAEEIIRRIVKE
ncbi:MAG: adenylate kinase [Candidatus ainarchaeum sp.]|jgi:adenylate kinase|nr:adenylate kinase [Candidatus ainarchaeum sp.]MDD4128417.1 adenylate kinase [Candidatus ainarchaeum sp.]HPM85490.1 adenylate kinase [archaeon]